MNASHFRRGFPGGPSRPANPTRRVLQAGSLPISFLFPIVAALAGMPGILRAQVPAEPVLEGEVVRGEAPFPEATVVLHRVTPAAAGEVDSVQVGPDGRFRFRLPSVPAADARSEVYFASVRHHGVLYFGSLLGEAVQLDSLYRVQVYDTASPPPGGRDFPVEVRNLVMEGALDGRWQATDLIQIRNDGDRTWVARGGSTGEPLWTYPLPRGASGFEVGQSDLPDDAVRFEGGTLQLYAPVPPGERLYVIRYALESPEVEIPMPGLTERVQLLVREPAPPLGVEGLLADQPVELEPGSTYRVYSGENLRDARVVLSLDGEGGDGVPVEWIAVILALVLGVAGVVAVGLRRGGGSPVPAGAGGGGTPNAASGAGAGAGSRAAILAEIARLDEAFEVGPGTEADREAWQARRRELKERLRAAE